MSEPVSTMHKDAFINTVCRRCGLCSEDIISPNFCLLNYDCDEERFLILIHRIQKVRKTNPLANLSSFEAFCGLFCNSTPKCPQKSSVCDLIDTRINCYAAFVSQWGKSIPKDVLAQIYHLYSGTVLDMVGKDLAFGSKKFSKKEIKRIAKKEKKIVQQTGRLLQKHNSKNAFVYCKATSKENKEKAVVSTHMFYNDDNEAWVSEINALLKAEETHGDKPSN